MSVPDVKVNIERPSGLEGATVDVSLTQSLHSAAATRYRLLRLPRERAPFVHFDREAVEGTVHGRFEQQVRLYPRRVAVKSRSREITYVGLNRQANRIARAILELCGRGDAPVALLTEKDPTHFAAILGVLKSGRPYVPLAPLHPRERNAGILADAGSILVVTDPSNRPSAESLACGRVPVLDIDDLDPDLDVTDLGLSVDPSSLAYILYTSGSTGQPKGVTETHRNLLHNVRNYTWDHGITTDDRLICLGPCAFSNILKDVYGALLNGAALYPVDIEREGFAGLADWVARERISLYNSVPTVFRHFLESLTQSVSFPTVRLVRCSGEAMTRDDVALFRRHFGDNCLLINGYGATETGSVVMFVVDRHTTVEEAVVPVGYPVEGMQVLILDAEGRRLPPGQVGEVAVQSVYLSPGYRNRPDLTARSFLPDPDGGLRRVYLTGDLGLIRPDGCLVVSGRTDSRVKLNGHRIEVAEVELALRRTPGVRDVAVVVRDDLPGAPGLVAYVVPRGGNVTPPSTSVLRKSLSTRLPPHEVPTVFVLLDELPRTATGKLDRRALPVPGPEHLGRSAQQVAPRNDVERLLTELWERLLNVRPVGVTDDFFELGGTSLLALRLFLEIHDLFGRNLPLSTIFEARTVERLARRIEASARSSPGDWSPLVPVQPRGSRPPIFCVHANGGQIFFYEKLAHHLGNDQPLIAVQAPSFRDRQVSRRFEDLAERYVRAILEYQPRGPYYLGGYSLGGGVAYEMAQQLRRAGHTVALLVVIDQRRPNLDPGVEWSPGATVRLLRNLPYALYLELLHEWGPRRLLSRARAVGRRALRLAGGALGRRARPDGAVTDRTNAEDDFRSYLEAANRALRAYVPQPYPGRVLLVKARAQPFGRWQEPMMGWGELFTGPCQLIEIAGSHLRLFDEPYVRGLARVVREHLVAVQRADTGQPPSAVGRI